MRMIPGIDGIMSADSIEMREFSCGCQHCMIGAQCEDLTQAQNPWKVCEIVPKNIICLNPL